LSPRGTKVALTAAIHGTFSAGEAVLDFFFSAIGGVVIGLALGWLFRQLIRRQTDVALSILISVLAAYAGYIVAEEAHVSGVLGAVVGGVYSGWHSHETIDAGTRLSAIAFWQVMTLGLEALLFILLGLQAPTLADQLDIGSLAGQALVVALAVVAVRMLFVLVPGGRFGDTLKERLVVGWAGMRGAISLAAALSVPLSVQERPEILLITFGVITVTLLGQGLTLSPLLKALRLPAENRWSP